MLGLRVPRALGKDGRDDPLALGDPTLLPGEMPLSRESEVSRLFGAQFAESLLELEPGAWRGPVRSGYGLHLVRVTGHEPATKPALEEVCDTVGLYVLVVRKQEVKDRIYQGMRKRYTVTVEEPAAGGDAQAMAESTAGEPEKMR